MRLYWERIHSVVVERGNRLEMDVRVAGAERSEAPVAADRASEALRPSHPSRWCGARGRVGKVKRDADENTQIRRLSLRERTFLRGAIAVTYRKTLSPRFAHVATTPSLITTSPSLLALGLPNVKSVIVSPVLMMNRSAPAPPVRISLLPSP